MDQKETVGVVGFGVMGAAMACNLARAGLSVLGYSRTAEKVAACREAGVIAVESLRELAEQANIVLLAVTDGVAVRETLLGDNGVARSTKRGTLVIDTSTIAPEEAIEIAAECSERGLSFIDSPVSGGDTGARNGTLTIMVGGAEQDVERARPILSVLGSKIFHVGPVGSGQKIKAVNQIAVSLSIVAMTEALAFAEAQGLDLTQTLEVIQGGAAGSWSLSNYAPRVLRGDLAPGFAASHMLKDLRIAANQVGEAVDLPGLDLAISLFERLVEKGGDQLGNHALNQIYQR